MSVYRISYIQEIVHWIDVGAHAEFSAIQRALAQDPDKWHVQSDTAFQPIKTL